MIGRVYQNHSRGMQQRVKYLSIFLAIFMIVLLTNILYRGIAANMWYSPGLYLGFFASITLLILNYKGYYKISVILTPISILIGLLLGIIIGKATEISFSYLASVVIVSLFFTTIRFTIIISLISVIILPACFIYVNSLSQINIWLLIEVLSADTMVVVLAFLFAKNVQIDLDEKSTLISEIQHRVNNTLEVIKSLLELQSLYLKDPKAEKAFDHLKTHILSIATVHKNISEINYHTIDFSKVVPKLIKINRGSRSDFSIEYPVAGQKKIDLRIEKSLPLSIIMTELIRYLSVSMTGKLYLEIIRKGNKIELFINGHDHGDTLMSEFISEKNPLSVMLVKKLLVQIEAEMTIKAKSNNILLISFSDIDEDMKFK